MQKTLIREDIETPRLRLVDGNLDFAPDIFEMAKNPIVSRYLTWYPHATIADSIWFLNHVRESFANNDAIDWIIQEKETGKSIGSIGLLKLQEWAPEIGYWIGEPYWGIGMVSEALAAVIDFAKRNAMESIIGRHAKENIGSGKVMMKNGFIYTGDREVERKWEKEIACYYALDL